MQEHYQIFKRGKEYRTIVAPRSVPVVVSRFDSY